jgi:hypothetical protein
MRNSCEGVTDESTILAFIDVWREASYSTIACCRNEMKGS